MKQKTGCIAALMLIAAGAVFANGSNQQQSTRSATPTLSPAGLSGDALAFSKFTKPVDVHIGMSVNPIDTTLPPGDTAQNNQYTRYLRDNYNINVIVDWTAAEGNDYNQKVSLAIASNTLPDALVFNSQSYLLKAAKSEMLYDLTGLFQQYASSQVKGIVDSTQGRAMEMVSYDGKMVALPNITVATDGVHVLNIQKNWLDQYGLAIPKTIDDIENVARVFKERRPAGAATIPIIGPDKNTKLYCNFIESSNLSNGFDPVFAAYDAYPGYFLNNGDGTVSYGSLDPKMRPALQRLAAWYKEGLIDPEMGSRDSSGEPVNANQVGLRFGPWWGIGYGNGDSFKNDPNANWQAYPVLSNDGKWNVHMKAPGVSSCVVSKKASADVAAAVIIMYNALVRDEAAFDTSVAIGWYPLRVVAAAMDETEYEYRELLKVLSGQTTPESYNNPMSIYKLMYHDAQLIKNVIPGFTTSRDLNVSDFSMANFGDFNRTYSLMVGNRPFATQKIDKEVYSVTYSMTDLLEQRWPNLWKMETEVMMKIVTGQADISAFDKFVTDWKAQGGQGVLDDIANTYLK
ncbi:MAG: extracellular solute-binding protein [Treponema sp.]|jgi:multiple sugar transport system substrate-binding protein/putative aldouronate transport system substrate-binding protein|nr:extracellular solute-binding protein [Treponema sp.]